MCMHELQPVYKVGTARGPVPRHNESKHHPRDLPPHAVRLRYRRKKSEQRYQALHPAYLSKLATQQRKEVGLQGLLMSKQRTAHRTYTCMPRTSASIKCVRTLACMVHTSCRAAIPTPQNKERDSEETRAHAALRGRDRVRAIQPT